VNQVESALVIRLRETIPWESSLEIASQGTLTSLDPSAALDSRKYLRRDRELAFRDLIGAAAVAEVSLRVSDAWNYEAIKPRLQGPSRSDLVNNPVEQTFNGTAASVRHVGYTSIPFDAAHYTDRDLYGRDAILYQTLAAACAIFDDPPVLPIDMAGTIPQVTAWSLAEGVALHADINPSLPLSRNVFKMPDQNLADRDNQVAGYVAQIVQVLKDPFAHANRIYVAVEVVDAREPEIYVLARTYWVAGNYLAGDEVYYQTSWYRALTGTGNAPTSVDWEAIDGPTLRNFVPEPALPNRNRIVYDTSAKTLQWFREITSQVHVPQIAALSIPGIAVGQTLDTLPQIPEPKDAQFWRAKAAQIIPQGDSLTDEMFVPFTASDIAVGGYIQSSAASLTVPSGIAFTLPETLQAGEHRVSILVDPSPVVDLMGAQNVQGTSGTLGGATYDVNPVAVQAGVQYLVVGGSGVSYAGSTYLPNQSFTALSGTTAYAPLGGSELRQFASVWKLSLPVGAWRASVEYTNLTGTTTGFGIRALYSPPSGDPVTVIQDTIEQPFVYGNGTLAQSVPVGFDVLTTDEFLFPIYWTYGDGQLQIRRLIFESNQIDHGHFIMAGTLGGDICPLDVLAKTGQPDVLVFEFSTGSVFSPVLSVNFTGEPLLPVKFSEFSVQAMGTYAPTPNTGNFQGWRQEMTERAVREVQNSFMLSVRAFGTNTPDFRNADGTWDESSTERYMAFIEVFQPRLREMPDIQDGDIRPGFQYEVELGTIVYDSVSYAVGQQFYGTEDGGVNFTGGGTLKQVGAFKRAEPGHLGKATILPHSLMFDLQTNKAVIATTGSNAFPELATLQPWMMHVGLYSVHPEFWMPENS
jgi:hypothetical protein